MPNTPADASRAPTINSRPPYFRRLDWLPPASFGEQASGQADDGFLFEQHRQRENEYTNPHEKHEVTDGGATPNTSTMWSQEQHHQRGNENTNPHEKHEVTDGGATPYPTAISRLRSAADS